MHARTRKYTQKQMHTSLHHVELHCCALMREYKGLNHLRYALDYTLLPSQSLAHTVIKRI